MASDSQFSLLKERRYGPLFLTQFLGAFNDNVFKNALVTLIAFQVATLSAGAVNTLSNVANALFILPFFLFSASAGQFADKYEKSFLIRGTKILEVVIMLCACVAFYLGSVTLLLVILFFMGSQATLFGPLKYGILPQHLREQELVGGNAIIETGTFLAILLGQIGGNVLVSLPGGSLWTALAVVALAVLGYLASRGIPRAEPVDPGLRINWNPLTETWRNIAFARQNRTVFLSILGNSWFWFLGGAYLAQLPNYTKQVLDGNENVYTLMLTLFSFGIGAGSLLCERLSGHKVEIGLVPLGSIGLTLFGIDLYFAAPAAHTAPGALGIMAFLAQAGSWRVVADIVLIGMFSGFFIVPLYALIQTRSEPSHRSRMIAANNIVNALFIVLSAIVAILLLGAGLTIPQLFLVVALMNAAVAIYIYTLVPEFLMRFLVWMLIHTIYRVKTRGLDNIPDAGPVVLASNHVSFVDALIIAGCVRRPARFVMDHRIFNTPVLNFIFRTAGAIPIAPIKEDPAMLERAFERIGEYLADGEVVCIFPEGQITRDGELNPFRRGIERIVEAHHAPVVPLALRGLWGSFFSRYGGKAMSRPFRRFYSKIELVAGAPIAPETVSAELLQARVAELRGDWK
ncbi:MAG: MFS transporter [Gammaproteobacteria bacterium]